MNATNQDMLKRIVRGRFGPAEMRFYDDSVTVTLIRDFGKNTPDGLKAIVTEMAVDSGIAPNYTVDVINGNRFKLREKKVNDPLVDPNWSQEQVAEFYEQHNQSLPNENVSETIGDNYDDGEDYRDTIGAVRDAVDIAHEESMLKKALIKSIERDTEDFIMKNLGAALVILGEANARVISLDQTKELLRFAFISGLWANARERDLEPLIEAFNGKFKKYAEQWQINEVSDDEAGHG